MPVMLRPKFGAKIAFSILGKPDAIQDKKSSLQKKISKALERQDTRLSR